MTRHPSRWSAAIALMIAAAPALLASPVLAQTPMSPGMPPPPPAAPPPPMAVSTAPAPPGVAAIVNGKKIFRFQVAHQALALYGTQILNTMVLIELINQQSAKEHIVITPAQVDAQVATIRQKALQQGAPGGLDAILAQRHETIAQLKEQLLPQMEAEALVEKTLPPAPALPLLYHARHLLIMTGASGPAMAPGVVTHHSDAEALAIIAKAQAELQAGKSFEDVANKYTEDPSGKGKGGDLGIINAGTQFQPDFLKAALALKPGQVTPSPVKSSYGYHLIKIDSTSAAPLPTEAKLYQDAGASAKVQADAARHQQVQAAIPNYVQGLKAKAKIVDYFTP